MMNTIKPTVINNRFKKRHITPAMVDKANRSNLVDLLVWWDSDAVAYRHGQYTLTEDAHCILYNDLLYNHYTGEAFNPLNTLMTYFGLSFPQAFYVLNHFTYKVNKAEAHEQAQALKCSAAELRERVGTDLNYILTADLTQSPDASIKAAALRRVYAYLCKTRGIDRDVVTHFLNMRYLAMDALHNLAFLTYRGEDVIAITKKGTDTRRPFKQNYVREAHTGFWYGSNTVSDFSEIYVFESCIDLMSYLTLAKWGKIAAPSKEACYISTNGVSTKYLQKLLDNASTIERVHFCYDSDAVGLRAADDFIRYDCRYRYKDKIIADTLVATLQEAAVKDWNEYLLKISRQ